jgi:ribonuclease Z
MIDLPDMHCITLGTGTPVIVEGRSGPCTVVLGCGMFFVVDCGPGTYRELALTGLPVGRITAIILTHFHSDHIGDLAEIMTFRWLANAGSKMTVYGPPGTTKVVNGFSMAYDNDRGYRTDHHSPMLNPKDWGFEVVEFIEPKDKIGRVTIFEDKASSMVVSAFEVDHTPVKPAYGYRFEMGGQVIVISGDTCKCASLIENCKGANVVVQEAMCCDFILVMSGVFKKEGVERTSKFLSDIVTYHTSVQECVEIAHTAKVPVMILTHLVPGPDGALLRWRWFKNVKRPVGFAGDVVLAEDGMIIRGDGKIIKAARRPVPLNPLFAIGVATAVIGGIVALLFHVLPLREEYSDSASSGTIVAAGLAVVGSVAALLVPKGAIYRL